MTLRQQVRIRNGNGTDGHRDFGGRAPGIKRRVAPGGPHGFLLEAGKQPVILDARKQSQYDLNPIKDIKILKGGLGAWTETRSDISPLGQEMYKALLGGS
jgi:hypothetical protein